MNAELSSKDFVAHQSLHGYVLLPILDVAKKVAWEQLLEDKDLGSDAKLLERLHNTNRLRDRYRSRGDYETEERFRQEVEKIKSIAY